MYLHCIGHLICCGGRGGLKMESEMDHVTPPLSAGRNTVLSRCYHGRWRSLHGEWRCERE